MISLIKWLFGIAIALLLVVVILALVVVIGASTYGIRKAFEEWELIEDECETISSTDPQDQR